MLVINTNELVPLKVFLGENACYLVYNVLYNIYTYKELVSDSRQHIHNQPEQTNQ